jgi:hypothetical protein
MSAKEIFSMLRQRLGMLPRGDRSIANGRIARRESSAGRERRPAIESSYAVSARMNAGGWR